MAPMIRALAPTIGKLLGLAAPVRPADSIYPLQPGRVLEIDLDGLTRGIDNVHIDVLLSPAFVEQAAAVVALVLDHQIGRVAAPGNGLGPTLRQWDDFRAAYVAMLEGAVHRAKRAGEPRLVALAQLAAIKLLLQLVAREVERRRQGYKGRLAALRDPTDPARAQIEKRLAHLARNRSAICAQAGRPLFSQLHKAESGTLADLRQSILGTRWALPEDVFTNPLVQADSADDDQVLMAHYLLLASGTGDAFGFAALEATLLGVFEAPAGSLPWIDAPENVDLLFDTEYPGPRSAGPGDAHEPGAAERAHAHAAFQRRLLARLEQRLGPELVRGIVAARAVVAAFPEHAAVLSAQQVHRVLSGAPGARKILAKLASMPGSGGRRHEEALRKAAARVAGASGRERRAHLLRFLKDFTRYRHDRAACGRVREALDGLTLLDDPRSVRLSRANNTLHEFLAPSEEVSASRTIHGHAVLKADVRGSTGMVAELEKRALNPASYFGLKLFEPIHDLLEAYGATKTFLEGDAVILTVLQEAGPTAQPWSVARACGLARRLLGVVQAANAASRKAGLPELELGIGLAYEDKAPAFLYDVDRPIMISSAISRADRLSSCSRLLRQARAERPRTWTNVEVYAIPATDGLRGEKGDERLRYNVNGVELEPAAFVKLGTEITLQELEVRLPGDDRATRFYAGTFPDTQGIAHPLLVREGIVRVFERSDPQQGAPTADRFYELVTSDVVAAAVAEAAKKRPDA
jgi:hypothetical protein